MPSALITETQLRESKKAILPRPAKSDKESGGSCWVGSGKVVAWVVGVLPGKDVTVGLASLVGGWIAAITGVAGSPAPASPGALQEIKKKPGIYFR